MNWIKRIWWALIVLAMCVTGGVWATWEPDKQLGQLVARWAPEPSTFVELDGMQVHVRDTGPRNDPTPIVLIHGMASSLHTWEGWQTQLQGKRRVISFDLPGFGLTGASPQSDYRIDSYTRFVLRLLDAQGVKQVTLVGNALGGEVAWQTAVLAPDRVKKLVLIGSDGYPQSALSMPLAFQMAGAKGWRWIVERVLSRSVVASSVRSVYGDPSKVTKDQIDRYYELSLRVGNRKALFLRMDQAQFGYSANLIRRIQQPTLVIWGGKDQMNPAENGPYFCRDIPKCKLVNLPELGHIPQEEDPAATLSAARAFLMAP